ncbi:M14 family metallopeptidase [Pendulispora rubella]|uniref:M14 family metallopeptidase n=1 Tax=Pendulispora rubella TaxID=2741070 RepID=A0ABZ2L7L2_9BACT
MHRIGSLALALVLTACSAHATAVAEPSAAGQWGNVRVEPGQKQSGFLPVAAGPDGATQLPMTIVRGAKPGPVVAVLAGVHGSEYVPILASQRLREQLDPKELSGTVVLVHSSNPPAFFQRTVYYSPVDWKNLNRVFPGKANGTLTERVAHVLTRDVIERADAMLDLHAGDANEALTPYVAYIADSPDPRLVARARDMALAFGIDVVKARTPGVLDPAHTKYTSDTAAARGKPAIGVELGQLAQAPEAEVARVADGVMRVLRHLHVLPGEARPVEHPRWLVRTESITATAEGILTTSLQPGQRVEAGERVGTIRDFFGQVLAEARAPIAGTVVYVTKTPPIRAGESIASIGQFDDAPPHANP